MAYPPLRQPKAIQNFQVKSKKCTVDDKYVILTLKNGTKLVVSSDAYNGILNTTKIYNCVFCKENIELNLKCKEVHKSSSFHKSNVTSHPHMEEMAENLLRKLDDRNSYCTICNLVITHCHRMHIQSDTHKEELNKAIMRASIYKPIKQ